jgi:hypothetical protein
MYSNILFWIINTPLFQMLSMLFSSPSALLVALWGMSGVRAIEQMSTERLELAALKKTAPAVNSRSGTISASASRNVGNVAV